MKTAGVIGLTCALALASSLHLQRVHATTERKNMSPKIALARKILMQKKYIKLNKAENNIT